MNQTFKPNVKKYKVLTPDGFRPFAGVSMRGVKPVLRLEFSRGAWIECTFDHKLYVGDDKFIPAEELEPGNHVMCIDGSVELLEKINLHRSEPVYDLIEVESKHRYYTNGLLSSNCQFLIFDETLINSAKLAEMTGREPLLTMGQTRWYKEIDPRATYLVALDPSLGTGGDFGAIQVFEMPSMEQVGEWRHNTTPIQTQVRLLREICLYIQEQGRSQGAEPQIYYSVENNTLGEAALMVIRDLGEENFPGLFLSEPIRKGHVRKFRKGFNTTHRTKVAACSQLKNLIETKKMTVNSKVMLSELKNYVATGVGFSAKRGESDDLISATLLIIRMANVLADWDPTVYDKITEHLEDEVEPLPFFVSTGF